MKKYFGFLLLICAFLPSYGGGGKKIKSSIRNLDIVLCLDLSASTNGLIVDVREQLWHIVNQALLMEPRPALRIGFVGFSRPSFKKENAYIKVVNDLTNDYDAVIHEMNKIKPSIEKGDQFVSAAIRTCVNHLNWSESPDAVKIIYITGNGMAVNPTNDYIKVCAEAKEKNITINTIYVTGNTNKGRELPGWHKIAEASNGMPSEISIGKKEIVNDHAINYVNLYEAFSRVNATYLCFNKNNIESYLNSREADSTAYAANPSCFYQRLSFRKSAEYHSQTAKWDLVEYFMKQGALPILDTLLLPDSLRDKDTEYIYNLTLTLKSQRQRASSVVDFIMAADFNRTMHQKFIAGELKDDNIFSRCVINMMIRKWQ